MTDTLDEEHFNIEIRKFLKQVGVTSQREIERAVQAALAAGRAAPGATLKAEMLLTVPALGLSHRVGGEIELRRKP